MLKPRRLIRRSEDILEQIETEINDISAEERIDWCQSNCTRAMLTLIEAVRMEALEDAEEADSADRRAVSNAQARMAKLLFERIAETLFALHEEEENDEHSSDGAPSDSGPPKSQRKNRKRYHRKPRRKHTRKAKEV